jgi:DNA-binding NarL/FixJ family response regulator
MLLRAFGVPAPGHEGAGQLILLIEPAQPTSHTLAPHLPPTTPIYLTPREESVTRYLLEGLTNKEIANKLSISEHTVKDHLKRLMKKTRVTTRTAVVSRLLGDHRLLAQLVNGNAPSADQDIHDLAV